MKEEILKQPGNSVYLKLYKASWTIPDPSSKLGFYVVIEEIYAVSREHALSKLLCNCFTQTKLKLGFPEYSSIKLTVLVNMIKWEVINDSSK